MRKFAIGEGVRQKSTGGTGTVLGIHEAFPPSDRSSYTVRFNSGPDSRVAEQDLELFDEHRSGIERRTIPDRRRVSIVKYQGECVLQSLSRVLEMSVDEVRKMFDESVRGQQDPSNINHVADVLMDNGFVVGQINKNKADQKGERCLVVMHNENGAGHAVVVFEDNRIFDPEKQFNENGGGFYGQCMALGWKVEYALVVRKLTVDS
jgi:hypothetical protein